MFVIDFHTYHKPELVHAGFGVLDSGKNSSDMLGRTLFLVDSPKLLTVWFV